MKQDPSEMFWSELIACVQILQRKYNANSVAMCHAIGRVAGYTIAVASTPTAAFACRTAIDDGMRLMITETRRRPPAILNALASKQVGEVLHS